jgi:type II secretory pathway component GspD/PulD (secretin)
VCEAISDWFGFSVLAAPEVGGKTVSGRLLCSTLGEAMDSVGVLTGERWRPLGPGIVVLGSKGEKVVRSLPTYGIPVEAIRTMVQQANVVAMGDRFLVEAEEQKIVELAQSMEELRKRPSVIVEIWMVDISEGAVDRVNAWLESLTVGLGYFAKSTLLGSADQVGKVSVVKGPRVNVDASFLLQLMQVDSGARVELRAQVQLLSGSDVRLSSGDVQEDVTYTTLPNATTGNGQLVSQINRRTVGLTLTMRGVAAGSSWNVHVELNDSSNTGSGSERQSNLTADRLIDPASGNYTLLGSFTRKTTERSRQGVPLLMEIPGVRSLVSKATTNTVHRSLMILIKPVGGVTVPE